MVPRELTTERLLLRQWREEDADSLYEIYTQPEFLVTMSAKTLAETRAQVQLFQRSWEEDGYAQWAACDRETGRLLGRIGLLRHHDWPLAERPVPEVGWVLHRDWWGRGLAVEGGQAGVRAWRDCLPNEPQLISITTPDNRRSLAVMNRCGLTPRGTARWHGYDVVWYALDR